MNIHQAHLISFSPTHTSQRIGEAIIRGLNNPAMAFTNLTLESVEKFEVAQNVLAVITVPVYGGHVAPLALERLKNVTAKGTPAVIVVVYGNRAYEKALIDLDTFVTAQGFKVIAGATFIGEHSYSSDKNPIAKGRPNADDLRFAELFGEKIRTKITEAADMEKLYGVDVMRIQRPKQPFLPLFRFLRKVVKLRKSGVVFPHIPETDPELCIHCGLCVDNCPAGAIIKGNECDTIAEKCIKCCACVKGCPQKARTFDTPFATLLSDCFQRPKEDRIII